MDQEPKPAPAGSGRLARWIPLGVVALVLAFLLAASGMFWLWLVLAVIFFIAAIWGTKSTVRHSIVFWVLLVFMLVIVIVGILTLFGPAIGRALNVNL